MHVIHPTIEVGSSLYQNARIFCLRVGVVSLTLEQAIQVIHLAMDEALNRRLRWASKQERVFPYLNTVLSWWDTNLLVMSDDEGGQASFCQDFYSEVLDPHLLQIEDFLDRYVGYSTWDVWYMRDIVGDIVIEKGTDFRILDWERRMGSGEWK